MNLTKRAINETDLKQLEILSGPTYTASNNRFTYVSTKVNEDNEYESHVYSTDTSTNQTKQWTFGKHSNTNFRINPSNTQAVFQSTRSGTSQLWLIDLDGGEPKQITFFQKGAYSPKWAPDGSSIFFSAPLNTDDDIHSQKELTCEEKQQIKKDKQKEPLVVNRLKYKSDAKGFHDDSNIQIIEYHLTTKQFKQWTTKSTDHSLHDISTDGKKLVFSSNWSEEADSQLISDLFLLNLHTQEFTLLTDGNSNYYNSRFSSDSSQIIAFGHDFDYAGATLTKLYLFELSSKERKEITNQWDIQLGDAMITDSRLGESEDGPIWSKDGKSIYFLGTDQGATSLYQTDLEGNLEKVYGEDNHVFGFTYFPDEESFILGISSPIDPGNFYELTSNRELSLLTNANKSLLEEIHVEQPEEITFTSSDGLAIQGWLLRPYNFEEGKKYPFILEVHGGPHAMYGNSFFHELQLLAAKGYVVVYTNPRGSHGYGQQFVNGVRENYGQGDYRDLMEAVDYCLDKYSFIDKDRLGVTGGSYGGFMTNWIVGHTNRFKAAVTQRSISNWLSFYGVSDIGFFFTKWEHGLNLLDGPEDLWDISPLKYAADIETPLLILHGELDFRCPIEQGEQLYVTLKHLKKEVEFIRFPGANHELSRSGDPSMRIKRLEQIGRWFDQYL